MKITNSTEKSPNPIILTGEHFFYNEDDCACPDGALVLTGATSPISENDCACPGPIVQTFGKTKAEATHIQTPHALIDQISPGFHLIFSPHAPAGPSVINETAWTRWMDFETPRGLEQPIDYSFAEQNLITPIRGTTHFQYNPPDTLTSWLHITNACNLDCLYCYVDKSGSHMSPEIGLGAVKKIFLTAQRHKFSRVKLKYAGGEPMLNFRLVKKLNHYAQSLSERMGIGLDQTLLSNGTQISTEDAAWIFREHIKLMISLDGIGESHNQVRPCKNGTGSFRQIAHTIEEIILPLGLIPRVSITVSKKNAATISQVVRYALEREIPVSLNFYRHTGFSNHPDELAFENESIIEGMLAAYRVFEEFLPTRPFLNGLLDRGQINAHLHTCGAGLNYMVITHEGKLAQCQMQLDNPVSSQLEGDLLSMVESGPIRNLPVERKTDCHDCVYRYRCTAGCPLEAHRGTSRWDAASPNCEIYQALFPAALRLEGLRLLKCNGYLQ